MNEPSIELKYGLGFAGAHYYMKVGFNLSGVVTGCKESEDNARKEAVELLKKLGIDIDISKQPFRHDGTL